MLRLSSLLQNLLLLSLALIVCSSASAQNKSGEKSNSMPAWPHAHGSLLYGEQARTLAKQCSRPPLTNIKGHWVPSSNQLSKLEKQLDQYLSAKYPEIRKNIGQLYFQYAGLIRNKKKIIYINTIDHYTQTNPDWRHTAMIVCDGGDMFWGLEYDPNTEEFSEMSFNTSLPRVSQTLIR